ncbi:MAG: AsmA-like C-terminal region-containing protein [Hyphomicrobiaceae bacterium]|nr:AsmA-like C-terminal region-containing protein [Hyphomicrobiaceae bacterium]
MTTTGRRAQSGRVIAYGDDAGPWHYLGLCAKIVIVPVFSLSVIAALVYVRLLQGPISLPFLAGPIESALKHEITGVEIKIEEVAVRLADGFRLEFELKNVRVAGERDETLALAPAATISLSRSALLAGRLAPESVALIQPRLLLFHGEDGSLSLKFSHPAEASAEPQPAAGAAPAVRSSPAAPTKAGEGGLGRIDVIKVLTDSSARARRREAASAYLREVALKSATVVIDGSGRRSVWRVPELALDLDHERSQSSIAGHARMESLAGPWTVNFRTIETTASNSLQLALSVQGLVPRGLARSVPSLAVLEGFDMPVWGEARIDLSSAGEILGGKITVDAAPGVLRVPWLGSVPQRIDGAHLELAYDSRQKRFDVAPSVLVWGDSRLQFTGSINYAAQSPEGPGWVYALRSAGGWLGAEPPATQRVKIDDWSAQGVLSPELQRVVLRQFRLRAGGTEISATGDITDLGGAMKARLEGRLGPMSAAMFRALWPSGMAPQTRRWVQQHLVRGQLNSGSFRFVSGEGAAAAPERASLALEASNVAFDLIEGWPAFEAPRALVRLDGHSFELAVPDGSITAGDGRRMSLKGNLTVDMGDEPHTGRVTLRGQGPLSLAHELLDRPPFRAEGEASSAIDKMDGRVEAQVALTIPFRDDLKAGDIKAEGKVRVLDGRMKAGFGNYEITSANITLDLAATSADARGELLVNGVVGKISWQHVFGAPPEKQPPLRITGSLDNSYRTQLGLDINDLVQGDVAVEVTIARDAQGERQVHVRCDLLNAELILDSVAWRKPKGRGAVFEFDYAKGSGATPIELRNVRLVGDNVALEGTIGAGADGKVREYRFPSLSLNVVSSLEVAGRLRSDGIWEVTARGNTYDGRELFRSFFDVGGAPDPTQKARPGLDLKAEIGTVIGHFDTSMRSVRVTLQKRGHKVTQLDVRGIFDGGKLFGAVIKPEGNKPRRLLAEATDAGQLYKLVGFYPNIAGGVMSLEVYLDGQGVAERTGTLWTRDFVILGDPIISEVLQNAEGGGSTSGGKRKVVREQFEFEQMRIPFSVGHGQFVMHSGYIRGPLIGASVRGKVDFRAQQLSVGGTYVPLSGLNRALAPIPLLGPLLTGPRGEGVLGITFAIQGPMSNPEVLVNPLSLVTPGIFREIMQMTPEDPVVLPRAAPPARSGAGPRSSSSPASGTASSAPDARPGGEVGSAWSTETSERKR